MVDEKPREDQGGEVPKSPSLQSDQGPNPDQELKPRRGGGGGRRSEAVAAQQAEEVPAEELGTKWTRGNDPEAAAKALREANRGTTGGQGLQ